MLRVFFMLLYGSFGLTAGAVFFFCYNCTIDIHTVVCYTLTVLIHIIHLRKAVKP